MSEQAFLQAIIENPDDDAPRLIFADWLDERGDPRAPFIRIQCRLARLPQGDRQVYELWPEEMRLSKPALDAFVRSVPEVLRPFFECGSGRGVYRRGLLATLLVRPDESLEYFIQHAREVFQFAPVQKVEFLPDCSDGGDIHRDITDATTPADKVRAFLRAPALERVRDLEMHGPFEDIDAVGRLLVECPHVGNLWRLFLNREYHIGDPFRLGTHTLLPSTQELLRKRFGTRVNW
jgi:uncharacterized protein (TIGR02996 family)